MSLDLETVCAAPGCEGTKCKHALDPYRNRITVAGVVFRSESGLIRAVFRDIGELARYLDGLGSYKLVGHNLKWDLHVLCAKGLDLSAHWEHDTNVMAVAAVDKVSPEYLSWYAEERKRLNSLLPKGKGHRAGTKHSLKTTAPYYLGVDPFWETPTNHDNDTYVLRDCEYTLRLYEFFEQRLREEQVWDFYTQKLMPWTKTLLTVERRGIALDLPLMDQLASEAERKAAELKVELDATWASAYAKKRTIELALLHAHYEEKCSAAQMKLKRPTFEALERTALRYRDLYEAAAAKVPHGLNLDSPDDLLWLFRDHFGLDCSDFHDDEGTGKAILQRLAVDRPDIALYLKYRSEQKLATAFFPSYKAKHVDGVLHASFHPDTVRTGRLSSSSPNLQQVPGHLHRIFQARPGFKLITKDESAIEPRLVAFYTHDANLYRIVASGEDFHGYNTRIFFELDTPVHLIKELHPLERKMAKEVGLSLFYGAGAGRLQETSQKYGFHWNQAYCRKVLARFKEFYAGVFAFRDEVIKPALHEGPISNIFGRRFSIYDPHDIHMQGFNTLMQGSASDLVWNSAVRIEAKFAEAGINGGVVLLVHDELVVEVEEARLEEAEAIINWAMTAYTLDTPLGPVKMLTEGKTAQCWEKG